MTVTLTAVALALMLVGGALLFNVGGAGDRVASQRLYERGLSTQKGARTRNEARFVGALAVVIGSVLIIAAVAR